MHVRRRPFYVLVSMLVAAGALVAPSAPAGALAPAAAGASLPDTVRADVLPTPQIDGVVWKQVIAGNVVYAGGQFTKARPFGSAAGKNTVTRNNMLAYSLTTGALDTSFAPSFNGKVSDMAVTPDGSKLVVVGSFTKVGTATRNRVAVFNLPSRTLNTAVVPSVNSAVKGVAVTNSTIFLAGGFSAIGSSKRNRVGSVSASDGTVQGLQIPVDNGVVTSIVVGPDGSQVVIGGTFTSVGGSDHPGFGLYRANATTGALLPLPVNDEYRNAGPNAGVFRLASDSTSFYSTGWNYLSKGGGGNSEGVVQGSWADGSLVNIEDCHGDSYDAAPIGDVVYVASHHHNCTTSGGLTQTPQYTYWHSTAFTKATEGTNTKDVYGYPDHPGTPRPELLPWFPTYVVGKYTGSYQAVWDVTGNSQYVVYGGEFLKVNGISQQGIVRYAVRSIAPNKSGPQPPVRGAFTARVRSLNAGEVRVSWLPLWDRDDAALTYRVFRNGAQVYQTTQDTRQWNGATMTFTDTGLATGSKPSYVVRAVDPDGNTVSTSAATTTVVAASTLDPYATQVLSDGATKFWRLDDSGSTVADLAGPDYTTAGSGVTRGTAGAISGNAASTFDGTANGVVVSTNLIHAPNTFTQEVWFKTTSTSGGTISSFGDGSSGNSFQRDRLIYMDTNGAIVFGVKQLWVPHTITSSAGLNDGQWHQAVATLGAGGMALYIDGAPAGSLPGQTQGEDYGGQWRIGGDSSYLWPVGFFSGAIDDYSVYPTELTPAQVASHWTASGH